MLRQVAKDLLPKEVFQKKKQGFNMNNYCWYKGYLGELARQMLTRRNLQDSPFQYEYLKKIMDKKPSPRYFWQYAQVWNAVAVEIWRKMYLEGDVRNPKFNIDHYM